MSRTTSNRSTVPSVTPWRNAFVTLLCALNVFVIGAAITSEKGDPIRTWAPLALIAEAIIGTAIGFAMWNKPHKTTR
jgi:hypothetical protein